MDDTTIFMTNESFHIMIEELVIKNKSTYIEAVLAFSDEHDLYPEDVKKLMTPNLIEKIKMDAINAGYFRADSTLPL